MLYSSKFLIFHMKKIILIISALSLCLVTNFASASSLNEVIPAKTDMYLEFNTATQNPLQDYLINKIPTIFVENDQSPQDNQIIKSFKDILSNNTLSFYLVNPEDFSASLKVTDTQYQNFINALGSKATIVSDNPQINSTGADFFFTKLNDLFIAAPTKDELLSILNNKGDKLNNNEGYKDISSEFSTNDTLDVYLSNTIFDNITAAKYGSADSSLTNNIKDAFKAFGLTLKQTTTGLNAKIITSFVAEKASELGINATANNFTPVLYKYLPSKNPIFYSEFSNLKNTIVSAINLLNKTAELSSDNLTVPTEMLPYLSLLEKEAAIYVQEDNQLLPAITILINTSTNNDLAANIIAKAKTTLEDGLTSKNIDYQKSTNKNLTTYTFDLSKLEKTNQIPEGMNKISITIGITPEHYLLLSTYSNIAAEYGEGLSKNSDFTTAFPNLNQTIAGITYFNIENLANWYGQILDSTNQLTTNDFTKKQIANNLDLLNQVKKPWHDLSIIKKTTAAHSSTEINLNFDLSAMNTDYLKTVENLFTSTETSFKYLKNSNQTFADVTSNQWYYQDIQDLNARGIISGYEDQSFKPNNNISRAEFLSMVLQSFKDLNLENLPGDTSIKFSDVTPNDWFANDVDQGIYYGIIKGYNDGNFHPNSPISRAEALSLLNKMIVLKLDNELTLPTKTTPASFSDVTPNDWFYQDVQSIYSYSIIDGDNNGNSFNPNRYLNRAEAAKIINKTLKEIDDATQPIATHPEQGNYNTPVVVQEFSDYQCPFCEIFQSQTFPAIKQKYIDTGKVKFVYYNFPLTEVHQDSYSAAKFAECSYKESDDATFLKINDKLYETIKNGKFDYDTMSQFATSLGINKDSLKQCFDNDQYKSSINDDIKYAEDHNINGIPSFLVNGTLVVGGADLENTIIDELSKAEAK